MRKEDEEKRETLRRGETLEEIGDRIEKDLCVWNSYLRKCVRSWNQSGQPQSLSSTAGGQAARFVNDEEKGGVHPFTRNGYHSRSDIPRTKAKPTRSPALAIEASEHAVESFMVMETLLRPRAGENGSYAEGRGYWSTRWNIDFHIAAAARRNPGHNNLVKGGTVYY